MLNFALEHVLDNMMSNSYQNFATLVKRSLYRTEDNTTEDIASEFLRAALSCKTGELGLLAATLIALCTKHHKTIRKHGCTCNLENESDVVVESDQSIMGIDYRGTKHRKWPLFLIKHVVKQLSGVDSVDNGCILAFPSADEWNTLLECLKAALSNFRDEFLAFINLSLLFIIAQGNDELVRGQLESSELWIILLSVLNEVLEKTARIAPLYGTLELLKIDSAVFDEDHLVIGIPFGQTLVPEDLSKISRDWPSHANTLRRYRLILLGQELARSFETILFSSSSDIHASTNHRWHEFSGRFHFHDSYQARLKKLQIKEKIWSLSADMERLVSEESQADDMKVGSNKPDLANDESSINLILGSLYPNVRPEVMLGNGFGGSSDIEDPKHSHPSILKIGLTVSLSKSFVYVAND